jgi:hypothetical protein
MPNQTICSIGHAQACVTKHVQPVSLLRRELSHERAEAKTSPKISVFEGFQTLSRPSASLFRPVETSKVSIAAAFLDQAKQSLNNSIKEML